jgi:hypothetical protein
VTDPLRPFWDLADVRAVVLTPDDVAAWPPGAFDRLAGLGLMVAAANASAVVCDACGGDHVEEILSLDPLSAGDPPRAYIPCPEAGRVPVALERLRRWQVDFRRLAVLTAEALATGQPAEVVAGRVWLLGRAAVGGQTYEVFIARAPAWQDGAEVVGRAGRLLASPRPLVLVVGSPPPASIWTGAAPYLLPLASVLTLGGSGLVIDRELLAAGVASGKPKGTPPPVVAVPVPRDATWGDIRLVVSEHSLDLEVRGVRRTLGFGDAGFEERRRRGVTDRLWALLRVFALCDGVLPCDASILGEKGKTNLKQNVSRLGKRLRAILPVDGSPFDFDRVGRKYRARFRITSAAGLRFPTPADATWDVVSVQEVREGVVEISVDAPECFVVRDQEAGKHGQWRGAERVAARSREFDLRALGLAGDDGAPDATGKLFLKVLRFGGKVARPEGDASMQRLSRKLCEFLQIDGPPFQFSPARRVWSSLFEASSALGNEAR